MSIPAAAAPRGYAVKFETVHGCGADLQLRSLLDRQQYDDPLGEADREGISSAAWPLFGLLWPSGQVLAGAMLAFEHRGLRILEVGCGLALASLVLHRRGADVTASDCHPLAPAFLAENLRLNDLAAMKYTRGHWQREDGALGRFDVIIGSDVLYDREQPEALSQFIERHAETVARVVIVDPDRGNQSSFRRKMGVLGYTHGESRIHRLPGGDVAYKGRVHRYARDARPLAAAAPAQLQ